MANPVTPGHSLNSCVHTLTGHFKYQTVVNDYQGTPGHSLNWCVHTLTGHFRYQTVVNDYQGKNQFLFETFSIYFFGLIVHTSWLETPKFTAFFSFNFHRPKYLVLVPIYLYVAFRCVEEHNIFFKLFWHLKKKTMRLGKSSPLHLRGHARDDRGHWSGTP